MPIFDRRQTAHWTPADYAVEADPGKAASSGDSALYRFPKPGSALHAQMLAATPMTYLLGYRLAIESAVPPAQHAGVFMLYWGMSTGGAFLYPLAQDLPPDGCLGWGTSSTGLAYLHRKATQGDFSGSYARAAPHCVCVNAARTTSRRTPKSSTRQRATSGGAGARPWTRIAW